MNSTVLHGICRSTSVSLTLKTSNLVPPVVPVQTLSCMYKLLRHVQSTSRCKSASRVTPKFEVQDDGRISLRFGYHFHAPICLRRAITPDGQVLGAERTQKGFMFKENHGRSSDGATGVVGGHNDHDDLLQQTHRNYWHLEIGKYEVDTVELLVTFSSILRLHSRRRTSGMSSYREKYHVLPTVPSQRTQSDCDSRATPAFRNLQCAHLYSVHASHCIRPT